MEMNKAAVGLLAALCVSAGAGGAYLASRASAPAPQEQTAITDSSAAPVEQSEAVVSEPVTAPPPAAFAPPPPSVPTPLAPRPVARPRPERTAPRPSPAPELPAETDNRPLTPPSLEASTPREPEPVRAPEPPRPQFQELVVSADSVLGLQIDSTISSERAQIEDEVVARVTRDVRVGDRVAIPAGAKAIGEVTLVERGGRVRERARLGVRFTSVVLADGTRVPLDTETIFREGDSPTNESAAKIGGGAIGGAILGGILGGAKGAIIGGSVGGGAGTAAVMAGGRNAATLQSGTPVTVRLTREATVTVEK